VKVSGAAGDFFFWRSAHPPTCVVGPHEPALIRSSLRRRLPPSRIEPFLFFRQLPHFPPPLLQAATFAVTWRDKAASYIAQLRDRAMGTPLVLSHVDWRLHLAMGQSTLSKTQDLKSIFSLQLGSAAAEVTFECWMMVVFVIVCKCAACMCVISHRCYQQQRNTL
jgi:hypothetical protein